MAKAKPKYTPKYEEPAPRRKAKPVPKQPPPLPSDAKNGHVFPCYLWHPTKGEMLFKTAESFAAHDDGQFQDTPIGSE